MSEHKNFADLLDNAVQAKKDQADQERLEAQQARDRENERLCLLFRPIITLLEQSKQAYHGLGITPQPRVNNATRKPDQSFSFSYWWPYFYHEANGTTAVSHEEGEFVIRKIESGYGYHRNDIVFKCMNAEDILPVLIDRMAETIRRRELKKNS